MIYFSFDFLPFITGGIVFWQKLDIGLAGATFSIWACGVGMSHVLIFHFAEEMNDVVAKIIMWNDFVFKQRQRRRCGFARRLVRSPSTVTSENSVLSIPNVTE